MANSDIIFYNTSNTSASNITTTGVYYGQTTYIPQVNWQQQPAYVYGDEGFPPNVVALPVDVSDDPIAWLKGRVQEMQDCWKEAA